MGRPQRPIDPRDGPVAAFACDLRRLRDEAGPPSYRELARRAGFSTTTLSDAAGGRSFPTLAVVRGFVRACGGDVGAWEQRWRSAADQIHQEPGAARSSPYLGLASYGEEHADLFFGRETLTRDLLRRLAAGRFLAVFGPSGSGKSSLLRAGLLAAVRRGDLESAADWPAILLHPGQQPVAELAARVAPLAGVPTEPLRRELLAEPAALHQAVTRTLAGRPAGAELLLVVDQFEELFTLCREPAHQDTFLRALLAAVAADGARTRVVLGIRADFYSQCARWPELVAALHDAQVLIGPMSADELRDVIVKPAERTGMTAENALVATALAEAGAEPGALALLSHSLLETWRLSPPGRMTLSAYRNAGGVPHAIASTAERVYAECDDSQREHLRRIFLRLVAIGDDIPDARRRVTPDELSGDSQEAAALVEELARARLITIDESSVQLAHEALIRYWPRLACWLADGRDGLRVQRRLAEAAREWVRLGRDAAVLYRGTPLAVARAWAERDGAVLRLTQVEREFLDASSAAQTAGQMAAVRTARRLRRLVGALVVLLLAVSVAGGVAGWQREAAVVAERDSVSGQLAERSAVLAPANADAAALAALAAWHAEPTVAARSALLSTAACCTSTQASLRGDDADIDAVALSPGGKLLAAGGQDGAVHMWDTASGRQVAVLRGPARQVDALAFSPAGGTLAAGSADGGIWLWSLASHKVLRVLAAGTGPVGGLAFSAHGVLASAAAGGQVRLWDPATGSSQPVPAVPPATRALAFSPDGGTLAVAGDDGTATLWRIIGLTRPHLARTLTPGSSATARAAVTSLTYSPDGTMIAAEGSSGHVVLWNLRRGTVTLINRASCGARGLAFSRDGTLLLVAGSSAHLHLFDSTTGRPVAPVRYQVPGKISTLAYDPGTGALALGGRFGAVQFWQKPVPPYADSDGPVTGMTLVPGQPRIASVTSSGALRLWNDQGSRTTVAVLGGKLDAVAASPDGRLLAVAKSDGSVSLLGLPGLGSTRDLRVPAPATAVGFSADGSLLAAAGGSTVVLRDAATGAARLTLHSRWGAVDAIAFRPDDRTVVAGTSRGNVVAWDTRTGRLLAWDGQGPGPVNAVAFSPDGRLLAAASNEGAITLSDPATLRRLGVLPKAAGPVRALAFYGDSRTLAAGAADGTISLWATRDRTLTATLTSRHGIVRALGFTPGDTTLFSAVGSRIIAWDLDPDAVAREDCEILAGDPGLRQAETLVPGASYAALCPAH